MVRATKVLRICDCDVIGDSPEACASLQDNGDDATVRHVAVDRSKRGNGTGRAAFRTLEAHTFPGRKSLLFARIETLGPKEFGEKMGYTAFADTTDRQERAS